MLILYDNAVYAQNVEYQYVHFVLLKAR